MKYLIPVFTLLIYLLVLSCSSDDNCNKSSGVSADDSNKENVHILSEKNGKSDSNSNYDTFTLNENLLSGNDSDNLGDITSSTSEEEKNFKFDHSSLTNFLKSQTPEKQKFIVNLDKKLNFIECENGTKILIPEKPFVDKNGNVVKGKVEISVVEYYKFSDMLVGRLSTSSGGHALETGGMIDLRVTQNGEELSLGPYQTLGLGFSSKQSSLSEMTLFLADIDKEGIPDWKEQKGIESVLIQYNSKICGKYNIETGNPVEFDLFESIKLSDKEIDYFIQNNYPELKLDVTFYKDGSARVMHIDPMPETLSERITQWFEDIECPQSNSLYLSGEVIHFKLQYTTLPYPFEFNGYIPPDITAYQRPSAQNMFKTSGLGWINCDRFYTDTRNKAIVYLEHNLSETPLFFIVLDSYSSIMESWRDNLGRNAFHGIPIGEKGTIYSLLIKDEKIFFEKQAVIISNKTIKVNLKEITEEKWRSDLLALD